MLSGSFISSASSVVSSASSSSSSYAPIPSVFGCASGMKCKNPEEAKKEYSGPKPREFKYCETCCLNHNPVRSKKTLDIQDWMGEFINGQGGCSFCPNKKASAMCYNRSKFQILIDEQENQAFYNTPDREKTWKCIQTLVTLAGAPPKTHINPVIKTKVDLLPENLSPSPSTPYWHKKTLFNKYIYTSFLELKCIIMCNVCYQTYMDTANRVRKRETKKRQRSKAKQDTQPPPEPKRAKT